MYGICKTCEEVFQDQNDFIVHACVQKSSRQERLDRLVKSGGCSQEYYDEQMSKK
jgi:hypothetical protein